MLPLTHLPQSPPFAEDATPIAGHVEAAVQACDAETAKQGQAYYAALAASGPTAVKGPAAKGPSRPSSAKPPAVSSNATAAQVRDGLVADVLSEACCKPAHGQFLVLISST